MLSIAGIELAVHEAFTGSLPAPGTGKQRWVRQPAYGLNGEIKQKLGRDDADLDIVAYLDDATMLLLKPVSEAGVPVAVIHDRAPLGVLMTMMEFTPVWDATEQGASWKTHIVMAES